MGSSRVLKLLFLVVFLVWLMIWVMLPTETYKMKWSPKLKKRLKSTYFAEQGVNLLLFSFPIMFIATLGGAYLHYEKKSKESRSNSVIKNKRLAFLKRPMFVMAPLGIVTASELVFAVMFIALLAWSLANYLSVSFAHPHKMMGAKPQKEWLTRFRSVSLRLGYIGNTCWAFLFFPVTRGSTILPLVGLTSESSIKYHIWLGHLSNVLFSAHTVGFIIYWAITNQLSDMQEWSKTYVSNLAGVIAIVIALAMWVTSLPRIRRKMFELFFYAHHLYALYILFYVLHVGVAYFCMILPGIFLFFIDRYLRFLQSRQRARLVSARILPGGTMEMNFCKTSGLKYNPTSIMFINVPSISKLQWHPFTVCSNANLESDILSLIVKTEGSWTQKLHQSLSSAGHLEVAVEGPYGPNSSDFLCHEMLVMVGGGSGVTPFISIIREIIFHSSKSNHKVPRVLLICAFKTHADLAMLHLLLPLNNTSELSNINLQIEAYVTREQVQPEAETQKHISTIWFKPNPRDSPIYPGLGPNSWLWLSAIIASSFVMFLLFLGIITRYYIYPFAMAAPDKNYHFSLKVMWDFFFICVSIFASASVVFLWCKKENANQIQNVEGPTPKTSPDRELESLPQQSLAQATNIHMGSRPDLKSLLTERKESDVGVLVCGPRKMRHDVAKICSSGLAKNLHFESISFNW